MVGTLSPTSVTRVTIHEVPLSLYVRQIGENILHFDVKEGVIIDREITSEWTVFGTCITGKLRGGTLEPVHSFDVVCMGCVLSRN